MTNHVTACDRNELTESAIVERLEAAWKTALAMPGNRYGPKRSVTMALDIVHDPEEAYGYHSLTSLVSQHKVSAEEISRMEEAIDWIVRFIDNKVHRKIVWARAQVHPVSGRYLHSWRTLGLTVGADYKSVQHWHRGAIKKIILGLAQTPQPNL